MAVHAGSLWLDANWNRLPPGLWVATDAQGIVAEDLDLNNVYNFLSNRGYKLIDVTIAFVPDGVIQ